MLSGYLMCFAQRRKEEEKAIQRRKRRSGKGKKEMLADKPLDFENCPLVRNNKLTEQRNLDEGERPMQALKLQFQN